MDITSSHRKIITRVSAMEMAEWRFVGVVIALILVITTIPYIYAYISTPADKQFMGIMLDVPDHVQYFSWMRDLATQNLVSNKLTPEPNRAIFFNLLWWMMGRLGRLLDVGYPVMFQLLRWLGGALFLLLAYRVCSWFLEDVLARRTAFLTIALTSGFGWMLVLLKYTLTKGTLLYPLDLYVAEGNTFLGILGYPHFISAALYIFAFDLVLRGQVKKQLRYAAAAGVVALFLGWQHAYDLVLVYGILGGYILLKLLRDRRLPTYLVESSLIIGIISWWPALYSVILTRADPIWREVLQQFANAGVYSPTPPHVIILLGVAFLLALYTVVRANPLRLKKWDDNQLFLLAWFLMNFLLIYIPTDFQIHMLNGWQVPIAILATMGLYRYIAPWLTKVSRRNIYPEQPLTPSVESVRRWLAVGLIVVILPTNLYLWTWRFTDLSQHDYPYYLYKDEISAMGWLESHGTQDDVVLSSLTIGQYVPALTGKHAFLAHWAQTLNFYDKEDKVSAFYDAATSDAQREQILKQFNVAYVFYGPAEQQIGSFAPANAPYLQEVFSSARVKVYRVAINN